jgi:hypothetical protein
MRRRLAEDLVDFDVHQIELVHSIFCMLGGLRLFALRRLLKALVLREGR